MDRQSFDDIIITDEQIEAVCENEALLDYATDIVDEWLSLKIDLAGKAPDEELLRTLGASMFVQGYLIRYNQERGL